jgi:isopentenyl-diphosphate delta-isomerase
LRDQVILVDELDRPLGAARKLQVHRAPGQLHRAFSVFVVGSGQQILLQRRSALKYHFPGLWTNACCGHPRPGEDLVPAAQCRLAEEMGLVAEPRALGSFVYRAVDASTGLVEHELDHVLLARSDVQPTPDPAEVDDWRWIHREDLDAELYRHPDTFTPWFPLALAVMDQCLE